MSVRPQLPVGERMRRVGIASWSIIGIVLLAGIGVWLLYRVRVIFPPLVLALLIIYLIGPIVDRLEARGVPRVGGALMAYVIVLGGLAILITALIPFIVRQSHDFGDQWPTFRNRIVRFVDNTTESIDDHLGLRLSTAQFSCLMGVDSTVSSSGPSPARCDAITERFRSQLTSSAARVTRIGFSVLEILLVFILAPLIALYLLIDLPQIRRDALSVIPARVRPDIAAVGSKVGRALGEFFRGQLLIAVTVGILSSAALWAIGLPFWLIVGAIAGIVSLIPNVGRYLAAVVAFFVASISSSWLLGLAAIVVEIAIDQLVSRVLTPRLLRRDVQLHAVTVILSLIAGAALFGIWGVIISVPAVMAAKVTATHLWSVHVLHMAPEAVTDP
ncbi:MAG: AI-2E family transporter [Actinomycetota bacterium]|nr:AI-2E family transporter [Actinomycetota bacterium]